MIGANISSNSGYSVTKIDYSIWLVCTSFVLLQFFLQLSSGVVIGSIMYEMKLSALTASILSGSFYIVYTILQIPAGILCDKKNPRVVLTLSALACSLGCIFFAASQTLAGLFFGRMLIGVGSSFAFVIMIHMVRSHYPIKYFSTLVGTSETLGFGATVIGIIGMGRFISYWGWRNFIDIAALLAAIIAVLCWLKVPNSTHEKSQIKHWDNLKKIVKNWRLWMNGMFIGLNFSTITVFGALWAAPFLQLKLNCSIRNASLVNALLFFGACIGCPLFGYLSSILRKRKPLIIGSCIVSAFLFMLVILFPSKNLITNSIIIFLLGLACCSYILSYAISNELAPANSLSTAAGFTNTLALVTAPVLQPLIGYILDFLSTDQIYTLSEYQKALVILPIGFLVSGILVTFLPEKP